MQTPPRGLINTLHSSEPSEGGVIFPIQGVGSTARGVFLTVGAIQF